MILIPSGPAVVKNGADTRPVEDRLRAYREKRRPGATPEPFGGRLAPAPGPLRRFVVHLHLARHRHFDLRLETDGVLRSWAVPHGPSLDPSVKRFAVLTEDHPLDYVDFEGVIPAGQYGAGSMIVWDAGAYRSLEGPGEGFEAGKLLFELYGHKLRGVFTLVRTKKGEGREWLWIKKPDGGARIGEDERLDMASVRSGLSVEALAGAGARLEALVETLRREGAPERAAGAEPPAPMLATPWDDAFTDPAWLFELKYDGYRLLASRTGGELRLRLRSGRDTTAAFPELVRSLEALPGGDLVLDGEAVVLEADGRPSFSRLARRAKRSRPSDIAVGELEHPVTYYAFDLLALGPLDLRGLPLARRKQALAELVPRLGAVRYTEHVVGAGEALFEQVKAAGVEGLVAKRLDAPYRSGRSPAWRKLRVERSDDLVVVGWTDPEGSRAGLGALHLATWEAGVLSYRGRVGTGFTDAELEDLRTRLAPLERDRPPCEGEDLPRRRIDHWVRPELVVEVKYRELTEDRHLRFAVFLRVREDKAPSECGDGAPEATPTPTRDEASGAGDHPRAAPAGTPRKVHREVPREVPISNPDKLLWPADGIPKRALVDYYAAIAPWLLPWLRDRLLVLTRFPDGIDGKSFFQRNAPDFTPPWVRTETRWSEADAREVQHFVCEDVATLRWLANLAVIPLHVWGSRLQHLDRPDWCSLDLDPKEASFADVVEVARHIRALCEDLGLPSFPKTSGSTGLHVLIPTGGLLSWDQCRQLATVLARVVADERPELATVERARRRRDGRVYVDAGQNGHGRVLAAPYSVRPRPGATVSTPLSWDEVVPGLDREAFTIRTVPARMAALGADPMAKLLDTKVDLSAAL